MIVRSDKAGETSAVDTCEVTLAHQLAWLDDELGRLSKEHDVPGAVVGVLQGDDSAVFVHGVTSLDTEVPVTPETVFQIGSNTKLYTASMAMVLEDSGDLNLDKAVVDYLPGFRTRSPELSSQVTVRQLMCHTSGIDGDFVGPEPHEFSSAMLERYVA